jgi:hypothetical protein
MGVKFVQLGSAGQDNQTPRICFIQTDNTIAEVIAAGFLNDLVQQGYAFTEADMVLVSTKTSPSATTTQVGWYEVSYSSPNWSLTSTGSPGSVALPTVTNQLAYATDVSGSLAAAGANIVNTGSFTNTGAISATTTVTGGTGVVATTGGVTAAAGNVSATTGNVVAGSDASAGYFESHPATTASGTLRLVAADSAGDTVTAITNASQAGARTFTIPDPGASAQFMMTTVPQDESASPIIVTNTTCGQAALATAGTVTIQASSGADQYRVLEIFLNSGGTNFAGGGGDRLGQVSDGTTVYSVIPAATMQSLVNARWGSTEVAFPAAAAINTATAAAADLYFAYSGGATDYTAGELTVTVILEKIA